MLQTTFTQYVHLCIFLERHFLAVSQGGHDYKMVRNLFLKGVPSPFQSTGRNQMTAEVASGSLFQSERGNYCELLF